MIIADKPGPEPTNINSTKMPHKVTTNDAAILNRHARGGGVREETHRWGLTVSKSPSYRQQSWLADVSE